MIYVMSDIHGCYKEYKKMLEKINFSDKDTLYILGDICERGLDTIKIILHMMEHKNIIPIWGNHDISTYDALSIVCDYAKEMANDKRYMVKKDMIDYFDYYQFEAWDHDEHHTLVQFAELPINKRYQILEYFRTFKKYVSLNTNGKNYILVHGGIPEDAKNLEDCELEELVYERPDYTKVYDKDLIIVCGHTPTPLINKDKEAKIYNQNNYINIDCGCVFGHKLACLCLDTGDEFYINHIID